MKYLYWQIRAVYPKKDKRAPEVVECLSEDGAPWCYVKMPKEEWKKEEYEDWTCDIDGLINEKNRKDKLLKYELYDDRLAMLEKWFTVVL